MIFEFERPRADKIRIKVRREPRPDVEVKLAVAQRALHDIRLAIYYTKNSTLATKIAEAAQERIG